MKLSCLLATMVVLLFAGGVSAAETTGFRKQIFNGVNLDGWHVTNCDVAVENGSLVIKDGNGLVRTDHRYGDFVLELKWKALKSSGYDSGIYIRCDLPPEGKPFPSRYQINLKQNDEGNLIGIKEGRSQGLIKAGDWNHFKITVIGDTAEMEINGQQAWKASGLQNRTGYVGLQVEVPLGGQFEFRDVFLTELGYRSLFNGQDLTGWEGAGQDAAACWRVENGWLECTGAKGPWLRSKEQFANFNLRLDYKINSGGNSGVFVRVPVNGNHHLPGPAGVEVQILDDKSDRYKSLKSWQYCGSVYDIAPATKHVCKDPGQWSTLEIHCEGTAYRVTHNGEVIVDAKEDEFPGLKERLLEGYLGLQNHSERVWFRDVRILDLGK